jgi:hypothetical protein
MTSSARAAALAYACNSGRVASICSQSSDLVRYILVYNPQAHVLDDISAQQELHGGVANRSSPGRASKNGSMAASHDQYAGYNTIDIVGSRNKYVEAQRWAPMCLYMQSRSCCMLGHAAFVCGHGTATD